MMMTIRQEDDERRALLAGDAKAPHEEQQPQSSRLEHAESSMLRFSHVLLWWWINPILSLGQKRQLTENDIDDAPHVDKSFMLLDKLDSYDWSLAATWIIVMKEFWKALLFASLFGLPFLLVSVAQPILFHQFICNIMNQQGSNTINYLFVALLFLSIVLYTPLERQSLFRLTRVGIRIRNALVMTIYKRLLSVKPTSSGQINTGQIINLMVNDTHRFDEVYTYFILLCKGIVETIIIFVLLCWIIGLIPTLCSLAMLSLFILIQWYSFHKFTQCRKTTALCSDRRIQAFSELIQGCHIVKVYNWEKPMGDHITKIREEELSSIRRMARLHASNMTQFFVSTSLLACAAFGSAWLLGYTLNPANTFTVLLLCGFLRNNLMYSIMLAIEKLSDARFASERIDLFMQLIRKQESQPPLVPSTINEQRKGAITMCNASFSWNDQTLCLSSLDLNIEPGAFVGIVGPVGSGKSSLLSAILGEMDLSDGQVSTNGSSFSYVAQTPWIFADTIRNNILLNRSFDKERYKNVIYACCLDLDLHLLGASGDLTMIGENGVNLSGGQKARVGLARALYGDADVYLLDDPLSAVDRVVATHIYERCVGRNGLLRSKTRLVVTHQTRFLYESDQIIFLRDGHINKQGSLNEDRLQEVDDSQSRKSTLSDLLHENTSVVDTHSIITRETSSSADSNWSVWYRLFSAPPSGIVGLCVLVVLLLLGEILNDSASYCLRIWMKESHTHGQSASKSVYLYFGLIVSTVVVDVLRTNYYFTVALNGSENLHNGMLRGILNTSIQFFESNPSGRILNRASKDQHIIDDVLPVTFLYGLIAGLITMGSIVIICIISPYLFFFFLLLVPIVWWLINFYQNSCRQLKRLESITRSPVYALFSTSLNGLSTIRAFKAQDSFIQLLSSRIDVNTSACILVQGASNWLAVRLSLACSLIFLVTSIRMLCFGNEIDPSAVALSLMSAMYASISFQWSMRRFTETDILMVSAERIHEYSQLPPEEDGGDGKAVVLASSNWPTQGIIEFENYSLRHRMNLECAIKNLNLRIESGEKIGIIGRTGAGKSSLFKGILRFVHRSCVNGKILIDGIDINHIKLDYFRTHISVIPQHSILFSGSLRYNLDPFNYYSDEECWKALEDVQLKEFVKKQTSALSMSITESGNNLSVGQCQLICIARAILKKSKILLIDEATANVDRMTDDLIQQVISEKFQDRTVITIAHRLNTLAKCDHIIVLDKGSLSNYDTAENILNAYS